MSRQVVFGHHVICGDVFDVLPALDAGSVHCCVTSPPYWGLRDYGVDGQLGLEATPDEYVANMVAVFREVRRVLRDDGTLWLNLGDSYAADRGGTYMPAGTLAGGVSGQGDESTMRGRGDKDNGNARRNCTKYGLKHKDLCGIPWRVAFALQADGWYLRSDIIWAKKNCMPESVRDRPTKAHEYIFLLAKSPTYYYDADAIRTPHTETSLARVQKPFHTSGTVAGRAVNGREDGDMSQFCHPKGANKRTVWHIATQPYPEAHFATYPEKLVEPCVLAGCPAQVCAECGAPWERLTEREHFRESERGERPSDYRALGQPQQAGVSCRVTTLGWQPTCTCNADTVPGTVLDPFTGSGTTGAVACRLGRNFVGVELNPEYAEMAERRIAPHRDQMQLVIP